MIHKKNPLGSLPSIEAFTETALPDMSPEAIASRFTDNESFRLAEAVGVTLLELFPLFGNRPSDEVKRISCIVFAFASAYDQRTGSKTDTSEEEQNTDTLGRVLHFFDRAGIYDKDIVDYFVLLLGSDASAFWVVYLGILYDVISIRTVKAALREMQKADSLLAFDEACRRFSVREISRRVTAVRSVLALMSSLPDTPAPTNQGGSAPSALTPENTFDSEKGNN